MTREFLLTISMAASALLSGCGKTASGGLDSGTSTSATGSPSNVQAIGSGSCANVSSNAGVTITFYGPLQQGSGIMGDLSAYGYGGSGFGGSNYYRNLSTGDSVNVYVNGTTAYATLVISANTAAAIVAGQQAYGGSAQVCGMEINESTFSSPYTGAGFTGTMAGGYIKLWGNGSWITYGPQYGYQPILF